MSKAKGFDITQAPVKRRKKSAIKASEVRRSAIAPNPKFKRKPQPRLSSLHGGSFAAQQKARRVPPPRRHQVEVLTDSDEEYVPPKASVPKKKVKRKVEHSAYDVNTSIRVPNRMSSVDIVRMTHVSKPVAWEVLNGILAFHPDLLERRYEMTDGEILTLKWRWYELCGSPDREIDFDEEDESFEEEEEDSEKDEAPMEIEVMNKRFAYALSTDYLAEFEDQFHGVKPEFVKLQLTNKNENFLETLVAKFLNLCEWYLKLDSSNIAFDLKTLIYSTTGMKMGTLRHFRNLLLLALVQYTCATALVTRYDNPRDLCFDDAGKKEVDELLARALKSNRKSTLAEDLYHKIWPGLKKKGKHFTGDMIFEIKEEKKPKTDAKSGKPTPLKPKPKPAPKKKTSTKRSNSSRGRRSKRSRGRG